MSRLEEIKEKYAHFNPYSDKVLPRDLFYLIRRVEKLEETLKFYANCSYHSKDLLSFPPIHQPSDYIIDGGRKAKEALAEEDL